MEVAGQLVGRLVRDLGRLGGLAMKIEVMGPGCVKCRRAEENISAVVRKLGLDAEVVHVTDLDEIVSRGVMMTPAVFIDGKKVLEGRVPTERQIRRWFEA